VRGADLSVLTSDNPRSEDPDQILALMASGAASVTAGEQGRWQVEPDRRAAIGLAVRAAAAGDVVVVAGKGHELGQEVAGEVRPFDDRTELRAAIEGLAEAS
jgi:UDP-N-acetylmuramoyl-L-alanyl-D-glutamate--2,6-diaminopimelate ligase